LTFPDGTTLAQGAFSMNRLICTLMTAALAAALAVPTFAADPPEPKKPRDLDKVFQKLDANSDSKVSFEEFKGKRDETKARKLFDRKDADKDGNLSLEEFKAELKKKKNA
jgi:hypothetical protein